MTIDVKKINAKCRILFLHSVMSIVLLEIIERIVTIVIVYHILLNFTIDRKKKKKIKTHTNQYYFQKIY